MTIRQLGTLNRYHVPALAMTIDAILNLFLITYFQSPLEILAVSNVGYVFATCAALSAFVLLRRDRPNWPRPVRLPTWYVPLGAALAGFNFILLVCGGFIYSGGFLGITGYGYGWDKTRTGLIVLIAAFLLYLYRHMVQDKIPVKLREEVPATPEEERRHPELQVTPDAVPSA
jgi:amino acid transporter